MFAAHFLLVTVVFSPVAALAKRSAVRKPLQAELADLLRTLGCDTAACQAYLADTDTEQCPSFAVCEKNGAISAVYVRPHARNAHD